MGITFTQYDNLRACSVISGQDWCEIRINPFSSERLRLMALFFSWRKKRYDLNHNKIKLALGLLLFLFSLHTWSTFCTVFPMSSYHAILPHHYLVSSYGFFKARLFVFCWRGWSKTLKQWMGLLKAHSRWLCFYGEREKDTTVQTYSDAVQYKSNGRKFLFYIFVPRRLEVLSSQKRKREREKNV